MDSYYINNLQQLIKQLQNDILSDEQIVASALLIIGLAYSCLTLDYPALDSRDSSVVRKLLPLGIIRQGSAADSPTLEELVSTQLDITFDPGRHISVKVPTGMIGSSTYVIFEVPQVASQNV